MTKESIYISFGLLNYMLNSFLQALYLIINNRSMLSMSLTMAQAYENYGDEDGFLYITYASQEVFGYQDGKFFLITNNS